MLVNAKQSALLIIDVQEKLLPAMEANQFLLQQIVKLSEIAELLDILRVVSEQHPKGLGSTIKPLLSTLADNKRLAKTAFSCAADPSCMAEIRNTQAKQIVVIGIEAHICVLQSCIELQEKGYQVLVVEDAVSSRKSTDKELAMARLDSASVQIISSEMLIFEWLRSANHPEFRTISKNYLS